MIKNRDKGLHIPSPHRDLSLIEKSKKNIPTEAEFDNMKRAEKDKLLKQLLKDKGLLR